MKKIITTILYALFATVFLPCAIHAQDRVDDFGMWNYAMAIKGWQNGAYATFRFEHRSFDNANSTEAWFLAAGGGYNFTKWLKADLGYEYWKIHRSTDAHRIVGSATGTLKSGNWAFSLRERYEFSINPGSESTSQLIRSRVRAQYSFKNPLTVTPYLMFEVFNGLSNSPGWIRNLNYAGCELSFCEHHTFDIFYMYHLYNAQVPSAPKTVFAGIHILGIGYNFKF